MRIVLADLKGGDGFISKDTVAGGYGSRLRPFSKVTSIVAGVKRGFHDLPSVHLAYAAALAARAGHDGGRRRAANWSTATSRSSCRRSSTTGVKRRGRARCGRAGRGSASSASRRDKLPHLFQADADFIVKGEPESALLRLVAGETLSGVVDEPADRRSRLAAVSAVGSARRHEAAVPRAVRRPAGRRFAAGARQPELPGVLHLLSASDPVHLPIAVGRQHPGRALVPRGHARAAAHRVSRSALHAGPRSRARAVRRHPQPRADPHLRMRDAARSPRRGAADDDAPRRAARDELRRRGGVAGDAEEGRPPADSGGAPARHPRALPRSRDRHRGVLRPRVRRGHLGVGRARRSTTRCSWDRRSRSSRS